MSKRIVLISLLVTGCAVQGGDNVADDDPGPTFTTAQAVAAGKVLGAGIEEAASWYGPITRNAGVDASCVSQTGDTSDADGDYIPASARLTFDCNKRRLGYTGVLTGTAGVSDSLPDQLAWAFDATTEMHASLTGPFGGSMVSDGGGSLVASQGSVLGPFRLDSVLDTVTVITNVAGDQVDITENLAGGIAFTPTLSWNPGADPVAGKPDADGTWVVGVDGHTAETSLSTPVKLTFRPSCETLITAGKVVAGFTAGSHYETITVRWTDCGQKNVTYDGNLALPDGL